MQRGKELPALPRHAVGRGQVASFVLIKSFSIHRFTHYLYMEREKAVVTHGSILSPFLIDDS